MSGGHYYISVGEQEHFYTLRYVFEEVVHFRIGRQTDSKVVRRDYHIQNLAQDKSQAIERAFQITGQHLAISYTKTPGRRRAEVDPSIILFGKKHIGKSIHQVQEEDPAYLVWAAENLHGTSHKPTLELIRALMVHELSERQSAREAQQAEAETQKIRVAGIVEELASRLKDGKGGFRDNVAQDLAEGVLPSDKALRLVVDILAKEHAGRRGTKAYTEEANRLWDILAVAKEDPEDQEEMRFFRRICG